MDKRFRSAWDEEPELVDANTYALPDTSNDSTPDLEIEDDYAALTLPEEQELFRARLNRVFKNAELTGDLRAQVSTLIVMDRSLQKALAEAKSAEKTPDDEQPITVDFIASCVADAKRALGAGSGGFGATHCYACMRPYDVPTPVEETLETNGDSND